MTLSEEQKEAVRGWLEEGASLSDVQRRLKKSYGLDMTYLDVRLLVLDIGATVKDKPEPKPPEPPTQEESAEAGEEDPYADLDDNPDAAPDVPGEEDAGAEKKAPVMTNVSLSLDKIVVPGAMVSGEATFTDGTKARWVIDQYGQFGLDTPSNPGYRPPSEDLREFQTQLRIQLRQHGYM